MVDDESSVLPSAAAIDPDEHDASDSLFQSRPSRPCHDEGWLDDDHYFDHDEPIDPCSVDWKEMYKDMDEIQVNGAIRRQWVRLGMEEVRQIIEISPARSPEAVHSANR